MFSVAGIVVDKRHAALTPETINVIVFLNKNSFMLGLNNECTIYIYKVQAWPDTWTDNESENKELVEDLEQAVDVEDVFIDKSESDDSE